MTKCYIFVLNVTCSRGETLSCNFKVWCIQAHRFTVHANLQIQVNDSVSMYFSYFIVVTLNEINPGNMI